MCIFYLKSNFNIIPNFIINLKNIIPKFKQNINNRPNMQFYSELSFVL